ncbi:MAG: M3 family metallopeptidase [Bacteroidia bacterium]|nr:M3 family metallopeptidase [Bacteroidia bacterium]
MKKLYKMLLISGLFSLTITGCKKKPEVDKSNPFFTDYNTTFDVPPFEKIMAKHYMPAFEKGMTDGRVEIEKLAKSKSTPTFINTIEAFDNTGDLLSKVSYVFFAQASANTNDSLQKIEMDISPVLSGYRDEILLNAELFKKIKSVYENQAEFNLNPEQTFLLENLYKGFVRNGANLNKQDQDTLKVLNKKLSVLTVKFSQNVLAETNNYKQYVNKEDLTGLPESVIANAAETAKASGQEGKWAFTTQRPSIFPFLQYSGIRNLRKQLYDAYTNRSNNGNEFDNNKILAEVVKLRAERAKLLGYKTHSNIVLEPRMAKVPENVFKLLDNLWGKAIPVAKNEVTEMQKIIDKEGGKFKLEPSDWWYYAEKLRKAKFDLNDSELRPYFKLDNVRDGAFTVANKLFGITFTPIAGLPRPHPDAQPFEVKEADGSHLGVLYMDFYPRESKQQGAWCGSYRSFHIVDNKGVTPVVTVVFNFTRPSGDLPALLSVEEASTLYHEFGHALDGLFNKSTYNETNIAWDFVELPSQLMEHWATEPEVLNMYAKHYKTNEPIPAELVRKIKNSGYFNQGFETVEYLAASLLDMKYHTLEAPVNIDVQNFENEYFTIIGLIPEIISRYRSTYFLHIAGGYDSGYYSYIWAAVLDNDAFEAFKEKGIFDQATATSFRKNILEKNGTMDAMQMFVNFRGREPVIEPLLKNRGLLQSTPL